MVFESLRECNLKFDFGFKFRTKTILQSLPGLPHVSCVLESDEGQPTFLSDYPEYKKLF